MDYGAFSDSTCLSQKVRNEIRYKILALLGNGSHDLKIPKWILLKDEENIIFGVCCENRILTEGDKWVDNKSRSIRGFFAIILSDYNIIEVKLPFDITYFKKLYLLEVEKFWYQRMLHTNQITDYISGDYNYIKATKNSYTSTLNTNIFKCKSLGNENREEVLASALNFDNISLLIDNDNIEQATNKNSPFMNCLSANVQTGGYAVKQKCSKCGKFVSAFVEKEICIECKENEDIIIEEEKMNRKLEEELGKANHKIETLESMIEYKTRCLKNKNTLIKILLIIIVLLLFALSYAYRDCMNFNIGKEKYSMIEKQEMYINRT